MCESDVAFSGVAGQAELLRRGEISARELAEISLERIARLDPELNAFAAVYHERALAAADAADRRRGEGDSHPLLGIPLAVKDEIDIAGEVTSTGTGAASTPARADAEVVRRLRAAGAVIVGKTTMPELGLWPFTESLHWGVTRNPWDTGRTPGGSSGGSAAAVAAGLVPAALGADGAGSIRIPAACCGLFGLKPQHGRVPMAPHDQTNPRWVVFGALTRSVLDSALVLDAIRGPVPGNPPALPDPESSFEAAARAQPPRLRIAVSDRFPPGTPGRLSPELRGALSRTADELRLLGHQVCERDIGLSARDSAVIAALLFRGIHDHIVDVERPERLERRTRAMRLPGALMSDQLRNRLRSMESRIAERMRSVFADIDILVTPTVSRPPPPAQAMEGRGAAVTYLWSAGWVPFNVLWNSTGQPAASVPAGFSADGLPLAVQLVAREHDETTLLSLAGQLEAARKWTEARPPGGGAGRPIPTTSS